MSRFTAAPWLLAMLVTLPGCGGCGGMSQSDMMARAISRSNDEDEEESVAATAGDSTTTGGGTAAATAEVQPAASGRTPGATPPGPADDADAGADDTRIASNGLPYVPEDLSTVDLSEAAISARLGRVGQAMNAYVAEHRAYPGHGSTTPAGLPGLSSRVELLPYLGHEDLYNLFRHAEPWDSPHNLRLLEMMPEVYATLDGRPGYTGIQVPLHTYTAFNGRRPVLIQRVEDGLGSTVIAVVTSPEKAVPWTKPADFEPPDRNQSEGLALFGGDHFLVLWGLGQPKPITASGRIDHYRAMFTIDGGEAFSAADLTYQPKVASDDPAPPATASTVGGSDAASGAPPVAGPVEGGGARGGPVSGSAPLAQRVRDLAQDALKRGDWEWAQDWLIAAEVLDERADLSASMKWVPALSRPAVLPRVGIGIEATITPRFRGKVEPFVDEENDLSRNWGPGSEFIDEYLGDFGNGVVGSLVGRMDAGQWGPYTRLPEDFRAGASTDIQLDEFRPITMRPGIDLLGVGSTQWLMDVARKRGLDVVLVFEVSLVQTRLRRTSNSTVLKVYDVVARKPLFESGKVNNLATEAARRDPLELDELARSLNRFDEWVRSEMVMSDPPELDPDAVREVLQLRMGQEWEGLAWPISLELRWYYQQGLISRVEYERTLQDVLKVDPQVLSDPDSEKALAALMQVRGDDELSRETRQALERPRDETASVRGRD